MAEGERCVAGNPFERNDWDVWKMIRHMMWRGNVCKVPSSLRFQRSFITDDVVSSIG